jgi:UDP-3-O-[3-hydroxymyristoyl] glucosamine N-acyltransferase
VRLAEIAERIGARLEGAGEKELRAVRSLEDAGPDDLSFVLDARQASRLEASRAGAIILPDRLPCVGRPALRMGNPSLGFARALALFHPSDASVSGIHPSAVISPDAAVNRTASIGPLCVVGAGAQIGAGTSLLAQVHVGRDVRIGSDCRVFPHVTLREGVRLGDRVILHSGAVIGADGFGYAREGARYVKIPQVGCVVLEDDVEIGANVTIDRATLGETRIGRGTKIDNLVQIAHNVQVGEDTVIVAQVGISGSTRIGSRVTLAGQVGVVGHLTIGDDVIIGAQSGVSKDISAGTVVLGSPAVPHGEFKRQYASLAGLPALRKLVRAMERRLEELERRLVG